MTTSSTALPDALKRATAEQQPKLLSALGFCCVVLFAFTQTAFPEVAKVTSTIAGVLGFWGLYKYGKSIQSHKLFRFVWASIFIQCLAWFLSRYSNPEWALEKPGLEYLTRFLIFIPIAWWVAQYKNGIWILFSSAALSICLSPWTTGYGLQEIFDGLNGKRIDFNLENAQHTSLFFGCVVVGVCCFLKRIYAINKFYILPAVIVIVYCLSAVFMSASRQSWLALFVTAFLVALYFTIKAFKGSKTNNKLRIITLFLFGFIGISSLLISNDTVVNRVMQEKEVLNDLSSLNFKDIPYSSFGIRLHSWEAATNFIKEKPIFGWGSNGQTLVMKHTKWLPDDIRKNFGHLHNTYIEILVNFGALGFIFYVFMWCYFSKLVHKAVREKKLDEDIGYFFASFLCFWIIMNCFEAYQNYWTGTFCLQVIMAGIIGKIWQKKLNPI